MAKYSKDCYVKMEKRIRCDEAQSLEDKFGKVGYSSTDLQKELREVNMKNKQLLIDLDSQIAEGLAKDFKMENMVAKLKEYRMQLESTTKHNTELIQINKEKDKKMEVMKSQLDQLKKDKKEMARAVPDEEKISIKSVKNVVEKVTASTTSSEDTKLMCAQALQLVEADIKFRKLKEAHESLKHDHTMTSISLRSARELSKLHEESRNDFKQSYEEAICTQHELQFKLDGIERENYQLSRRYNHEQSKRKHLETEVQTMAGHLQNMYREMERQKERAGRYYFMLCEAECLASNLKIVATPKFSCIPAIFSSRKRRKLEILEQLGQLCRNVPLLDEYKPFEPG